MLVIYRGFCCSAADYTREEYSSSGQTYRNLYPTSRWSTFSPNSVGTKQASRGWGIGRGVTSPQPTTRSGERRELPQWVQGSPRQKNEFFIWVHSGRQRTLLVEIYCNIMRNAQLLYLLLLIFPKKPSPIFSCSISYKIYTV